MNVKFFDSNRIAEENGCEHVNDAGYYSTTTYSDEWSYQVCIDLHTKLKLRKFTASKHYTLKRCEMTNEVLALCLLFNGEDGWRLDRVHPVGECPHCVYRLIP